MTYAFTRVPNALIDTALPRLSGAEAKLLIVLIRQTLGFQRDEVNLSFSQLIRLTGIGSRATLNQAITGLAAMKLFTIDRTHGSTNQYQINHDLFEPVQKLNSPSSETEPPDASSLYIGTDTELVEATSQDTSSKNELPPGQKVNQSSTKTEPVPVQKLNYLKRNEKEKNKEMEKEKHQPDQPESFQRGIRGGGVDAEALRLLTDFGLWESAARRLIEEQELTSEVISSAIDAIREEKRDGAHIQNPAALLRRRLDIGWRPESRKTDYFLPEVDETRKPERRIPPTFMTASFQDSDGRRWQVEDFTEWLMEQLALQLPREAFTTWLKPASFKDGAITEDKLTSLTLKLVSQQAYAWVTLRLAKVIERTAATMLGYPIEWNYTIPARDERAA